MSPSQKVIRDSSDVPLRVRMRKDLVAVETRHRHESAVVIKDPVAMKFHRLQPREYFLLRLLTKGATLRSLREAYETEFAPDKVTLPELNDLLFRFHRLGLTLSESVGQGEPLLDRCREERRQRWFAALTGILYIRFPGVDPEPALRRFYPLVAPIFHPIGLATAVLICLAAVLGLASHWDRFVSELPQMQQWLQLRAVLTLAMVLGATKILHELGHAIVCKRMGGECHEIGPMLLVFTPALYCDTSDSWLLPNRYARAAVGLAGMATEILLAAIATVIWLCTGPSLVHYLALNVMLVCSVSTVLFNANPLLRYDGYYVLADLCDVPNLAQKSRGVLARWLGRICLGVAIPEPEPVSRRQRFWLTFYAVAAGVYRWVLTLFILWFILVVLRPFRLESIGHVLCFIAVGGLLWSTLRGPITFLRHPAQRRMIRMRRLLQTVVVGGILFAAAWIPLPTGESATGRIVPQHETPVYLASGGHLESIHAHPGESVAEGQLIAKLSHPDLQYQHAKATARLQTQRTLVEALRTSQTTLDEAANELPAAEALLDELQRQVALHQSRLDALTVLAPASGRLIVGPSREEEPDDAIRLIRWSGHGLEDANQGCFFEAGTELAAIAEEDQWDAELTVTAGVAARVEAGHQVKLVLESDPSRVIRGVVSSVSVNQWTVAENRQRRDDTDVSQQTAPPGVSYAIRVNLESAGDAAITGAEVAAQISTEPRSLANRIADALNRLFRFR